MFHGIMVTSSQPPITVLFIVYSNIIDYNKQSHALALLEFGHLVVKYCATNGQFVGGNIWLP